MTTAVRGEDASVTGGGATVAETYERLQAASAARDVVAMAALLEPTSRAVLLRDLYRRRSSFTAAVWKALFLMHVTQRPSTV